MKTLETNICINASPEKVWAVLSNFKNYPEWNPFIKSIDGEVEIGKTIEVRIEPAGAQGMSFRPVVLAYKLNEEFRWKGKLMVKGLFDGEHQFKLINNADGTTTLHHSEKFTGILVPLFAKMIDVNTRKGFELMNEKLKELAEG